MLALIAAFMLLRPRAPRVAEHPLVLVHPTPAFTPARAHAGSPWSQDQRRSARSAIDSALARGVDGAQAVSAIVLAHDGSVLYSRTPSSAVMPASTLKLVVATAALERLGPSYAYHTFLAATRPVEDGVLHGDLFLVGSGDPSFRSSELMRGIAALKASGLRRIDGRVVVDSSAIAGEEINPLWNANDVNEDFNAATSGISLDEDTVEFHVQGTSPGVPALVSLNPKSAAVHYSGTVMTGSGDDVTIGGTMTPNEFVLSGAIPPGIRETFYLPVHGIPQYVASVAAAMLRSEGIAFAGAQTGTAPLDASVLWDRRSPPLRALVQHMLVHSDNHYAEQLMRTLGGAEALNSTDAGGIAAENAVLRNLAIPADGVHLTDGSGLARANRISARTIAALLLHAERHEGGNALYPLLPRAGYDGTLRHYRFGAAKGRVRAKSGHLEDVASLAGYIDTAHHGRLTFAFLVDGSPGDPDGAIVAALDRLVTF